MMCSLKLEAIKENMQSTMLRSQIITAASSINHYLLHCYESSSILEVHLQRSSFSENICNAFNDELRGIGMLMCGLESGFFILLC